MLFLFRFILIIGLMFCYKAFWFFLEGISFCDYRKRRLAYILFAIGVIVILTIMQIGFN